MRSAKALLATTTVFAASAVTLFAAVPAFAEGPATINLTITDKGCEPMQLTVPPEKVAFKIKNASKRGVEWEILKDNMVVEERENIIPGFTATLTTTLKPTDYDMTCGLLSNPKGKLLVKVATKGEAEAQPGNLDATIKTYKGYVANETAEMVAKTKVLVEAIKAGQLAAAQKAYAPAHMYYERIEPVAEVFNDLDKSMDSRADDYEKKEGRPCLLRLPPARVRPVRQDIDRWSGRLRRPPDEGRRRPAGAYRQARDHTEGAGRRRRRTHRGGRLEEDRR